MTTYEYFVVEQRFRYHNTSLSKDVGSYGTLEEAFSNKPKDNIQLLVQVYYIVEVRCIDE